MKEAGGIPFLSCLRAGVLEKMHLVIHTYVFIILDDVGGEGRDSDPGFIQVNYLPAEMKYNC